MRSKAMDAKGLLRVKARHHPRVGADLPIKVRRNGLELRATAKDVSLAGLTLRGLTATPAERLTLSISLPGDREVVAACEVRRRRGNEVGVEFTQLGWDDLFALARFVHPRLP